MGTRVHQLLPFPIPYSPFPIPYSPFPIPAFSPRIIAAMPKTRIARETWLFWLLAALVLAAGLGLRDPWPADEPRLARVAKPMVEGGDWLCPQRGAAH